MNIKNFYLKRDGKIISKHTSYNTALMRLQCIYPFSWEYAFKFGGWTIEEKSK